MNWTRLHDPARNPAHWTELVRETQFVVFVVDAVNRAPRDADGRPFCGADGTETPQCAALCDDLADAERFCAEVVSRHPELCCEVYDHEGKAKPALKTIYDPAARDKHVGVAHARRQAMIGGGLFTIGVTLAIIDFIHNFAFIWGYVLGLKCMLLGGIFLSRGFLEWREYRHGKRT